MITIKIKWGSRFLIINVDYVETEIQDDTVEPPEKSLQKPPHQHTTTEAIIK